MLMQYLAALFHTSTIVTAYLGHKVCVDFLHITSGQDADTIALAFAPLQAAHPQLGIHRQKYRGAKPRN